MQETSRLSPEQIQRLMEKCCLRKKNMSLERANRVVDLEASQGRLIFFYSCFLCGSYHMTSNEPKKGLQAFLERLFKNSGKG